MKGSKRELSPGVWQLRVYVGRAADGRVVHRHKTVHGGVRAADAALRRLVDEVEGERVPLADDCTVAQLLERWLAHIEADRRPSTLADYRGKVAGRLNPAFGSLRLSRLSPLHLDAAYRAWLAEGLSVGTIRKLHAILGAACHQAVRWGVLVAAPTDRATLPRGVHVERGRMTTADLAALVRSRDVASGDVFGTAVLLGAFTGARRGELCALRWSDVGPDGDVLAISRSLTVFPAGHDPAWTEGPTKTARARPVQLGPQARAVLSRRLAAQVAYAAEVGVDLRADAFVLSRAADGSQPCLPDGLTLAFARAAKAAGLPWHFHDLRHYAASVAMAARANPRAVADRLGHANPSMTLDVYAHADADEDRALAALIEAPLAELL